MILDIDFDSYQVSLRFHTLLLLFYLFVDRFRTKMGYQENEEVYLTLSRKELQGLCKKHGLPTTYGKPELVKMLVTHFTVIYVYRYAICTADLKQYHIFIVLWALQKKAASKERQRKKSRVGSSEREFKLLKQANLEGNISVYILYSISFVPQS